MTSSASDPRPPPLAILVFLTMLGNVGMNILVPSTPSIAADFASSQATAQWTLTIYLIGISTGQLIYGPLSDRFGRRPIMLIGLTLFLAGSLAGMLANSIDMLIIARLAQALGGCAGTVLTRAIVRDVYGRDEATSALGYIAMTMVIGPALAPAIGGFLDTNFGWRAVLVFLALMCVMVYLASLRWLHETHFARVGRLNLGKIYRDYFQLLRAPAYLGYVFVIAVSAGMFFTFLTSAAHISARILGVGPDVFGIYFIIVATGFASGSFTAGRLGLKFGSRKLIVSGVILTAVGILAMFILWTQFSPNVLMFFATMAVITFGNGLLQPGCIAGALSQRPDIAGAAAGLLGFAQMSIAALATYVAGLFLSDSALPMVWQFFVFLLAAIAALLLALKFDR